MRLPLLPLLAAIALPASAQDIQLPRFVDATAASGIDYVNVCGAPPGSKGWLSEGMGAGAGWLDYDGDGNLDLFVVNGSTYERGPGKGEPNRLFRGDGKGGFTDVTAKAGVGDRGWGYGVAIGDIDNDGDPDLFVTNLGENVLYRNRGDGTFENITQKSGIQGAGWSASAAFFDMDGDADLDLYVNNYMESDPEKIQRRGSEAARMASCTYKGIAVVCGPLGQTPLQDVLYRNEGGGRFVDITAAAGLLLEKPRFALGVVSGDYDRDGDQDLYVANDSVVNSLWQNQGNGKFVDVALGSLAALNVDGRAQAGMGVDFGDYDDDGWPDIAITNFSHDTNSIYRNQQGKFFLDSSAPAGMGISQLFLSWGTAFYDLNNDGALDLFVANGHIYPQVDGNEMGTRYKQPNHLFLNRGGRFEEVAAKSGPGLALERSFRGAAFADYDNDGDVDIYVTTLSDAGVLLRNDTPGKQHYLELELVGKRSNRDAVGCRVTLTRDGRSMTRECKGGGSYLSASSKRLHFGLGTSTKIPELSIRWPDGTQQTVTPKGIDRLITIHEAAAD